jgi:hypothetical protein
MLPQSQDQILRNSDTLAIRSLTVFSPSSSASLVHQHIVESTRNHTFTNIEGMTSDQHSTLPLDLRNSGRKSIPLQHLIQVYQGCQRLAKRTTVSQKWNTSNTVKRDVMSTNIKEMGVICSRSRANGTSIKTLNTQYSGME